METLKNKKVPTLDQQIKFVHDARKLLESNPDVEIRWYADAVESFRAIEENLLALKLSRHVVLNVNSLVGQIYLSSNDLADSSKMQAAVAKSLLDIINAAMFNDLKRYPVDTDVDIEIGVNGKTEWVPGHVHHYEDGNPVVIAHFGKTFVITDPLKIREMEGEDA
jgi:hypothetical protein